MKVALSLLSAVADHASNFESGLPMMHKSVLSSSQKSQKSSGIIYNLVGAPKSDAFLLIFTKKARAFTHFYSFLPISAHFWNRPRIVLTIGPTGLYKNFCLMSDKLSVER